MTTSLTTENKASLVARFAARYGVDPAKLLDTLKATAFKVKEGTVSNEQMMALLVVADQYGLNPFTKEIYAFPDKQNGIVPVVGVDGWARLINAHPAFDGIEFRWSEKIVTSETKEHASCPEWCDAIIHRKDRSHPTVVREYLDEVYRPPYKGRKDGREYTVIGPWQTHTKRLLRWKSMIQCSRVGMGYVGIYDEDEATRIIERDMGAAEVVGTDRPTLRDQLRRRPAAEPERALDPTTAYAEVSGAKPSGNDIEPRTHNPPSEQEVESMLRRANGRDLIESAAALIADVPDDAARVRLATLYDARLQEVGA